MIITLEIYLINYFICSVPAQAPKPVAVPVPVPVPVPVTVISSNSNERARNSLSTIDNEVGVLSDSSSSSGDSSSDSSDSDSDMDNVPSATTISTNGIYLFYYFTGTKVAFNKNHFAYKKKNCLGSKNFDSYQENFYLTQEIFFIIN